MSNINSRMMKIFLAAVMLVITLGVTGNAQQSNARPTEQQQQRRGLITIKVDTHQSGSATTSAARFDAIAAFSTPINLKVDDADAAALSRELSSQVGCDVTITPAHPQDVIISIDIKMVPLYDIFHFLADNYQDVEIKVCGFTFKDLEIERHALYSAINVRFDIHAVEVPLSTIISVIGPLSPRKIEITDGDGTRLVTVHANKTTLPELIKMLNEQTGAQIRY